jgi:hypothetical protein
MPIFWAKRVVTRVVAAAVMALSASTHAAMAESVALPAGWVAAWSAAAQAVPPPADAPSFNRAPDTAGRTVRQVIYPTLSGTSARVRLTNAFGVGPITLHALTIGESGRGAELVAGTVHTFTFGGKPDVTIAPGAALWSDPVSLPIGAGRALAVSFVAPGD